MPIISTTTGSFVEPTISDPIGFCIPLWARPGYDFQGLGGYAGVFCPAMQRVQDEAG